LPPLVFDQTAKICALFILMLVGVLKKGLRFTKRTINGIVLIFYFGFLCSVGKAKLRPGYIWMGWPGSHENRLRRVFSPGTVLLDFDEVVASDWRGRWVSIGQHEKRHFFFPIRSRN